MQHHKVGEANEPAMYRINDDLVIKMFRFWYIVCHVFSN